MTIKAHPGRGVIVIEDRSNHDERGRLDLDVGYDLLSSWVTVEAVHGEVERRPDAKVAFTPDVTITDGELMIRDGEGGWSDLLPDRLDPGVYSVVPQVKGRAESRGAWPGSMSPGTRRSASRSSTGGCPS